MPETSWSKRYSALVKELRASSSIKNVKSQANRGATPASVEAIAKQHGIDPSVLAPWTEHDGVTLQWESKAKDTGRIEILPLAEVFGNWADTVYFDFTPAKSKLRKLRPFDFFGFGNAACAALLVDGAARPGIHLYHFGEGDIIPLKLELAEYFELLGTTRGFAYWQSAIAADRNPRLAATKEAETFRTRAPELFPDIDLKKLLPKTKANVEAKAKTKAPAGRGFPAITAALTAAGVQYRVPKTRPKYAMRDNVLLVKKTSANLRRLEEVLVSVVSPAWVDAAKDLREANLVKGDLEVHAE